MACDTTVSDSGSIQTAINNASSSDVICVESGTYSTSTESSLSSFPITVNKPLTLKATGSASSTIDMGDESAGIFLDTNDIGGSVTLDGFEITSNDKATGTAIMISEGFAGDATVTDIIVENNNIHNVALGLNAWGFGDGNNTVKSLVIRNNTFEELGPTSDTGGFGLLLEELASRNEDNIEGFAAEIEGNEFNNIYSTSTSEADDYGQGVMVMPSHNGTTTGETAANAELNNNSFSGVPIGASVVGDVTNTAIHYNDFSGTDTGVSALSAQGEDIENGPLDASQNYWGQPEEPSGLVSGDVNYAPWYATSDFAEDVKVADSNDDPRAYSGTIQDAVEEAIAENPDAVEDYHDGEGGAINFLVGQVMQKTGGSADPGDVNQLLREELDG